MYSATVYRISDVMIICKLSSTILFTFVIAHSFNYESEVANVECTVCQFCHVANNIEFVTLQSLGVNGPLVLGQVGRGPPPEPPNPRQVGRELLTFDDLAKIN